MVKRWGMFVAVVGLFVGGMVPAPAAVGDWGGAGVVTGTLRYERLPALFKVCEWNVPFEVHLDTPAFALETPTGPQVVPFSLRGTGTGAGNCVSEGSAGGTFDIEMRIGDLRCDGIAGYTRFGPWLQMVAGLSACDNGERPVGGWVFELAYTNGRLAGPVSLLPA